MTFPRYCPQCHGAGGAYFVDGRQSNSDPEGEHGERWIVCPTCDGDGVV